MEQDIKVLSLGFVNAFLVKLRQGFILIDTGLPGQWSMLESELKSAGCSPGKLKLVICTHGDHDHTGNCKKLQEKYKTKIAMHKTDYDIIKSGKIVKRHIKSLGFRIMFFFARLIRKLIGRKPVLNMFKIDLFLKDGQSLKGFGFDAKVMHVPGHTTGSIAILTKENDFFAGDTFVNNKRPDSARIIENDD